MSLLTIVLVLAQAVNLFLLLGERNLVTRTNFYNQSVNVSADLMINRPDLSTLRLPYSLRNRQDLRGAFFYSRRNRAGGQKKAAAKPKLEAKLRSALEENGFSPISIHVRLIKDRSRSRSSPRTSPETRGNRGMRPPPHRRPNADFRPNRRPPHTGQGAGARGPFRPPNPPGKGRAPAPGMQELVISVELEPGIWFNAMLPHYPREVLAPRVILATAILLLLTLLVSWFFIRRIANPYLKFAQAAEKLGRGENPEPLLEDGPEDVRRAASAFNTMQNRLTRLIESQRVMLRAVGHDLKTPLTAMRLDVENLDSGQTQDRLVASITDMTALTQDMLSWAKDLSGLEPLAPVNLASFLSSLSEDYKARGKQVECIEPKETIVSIRRVAMKRALQNIINNGLQYGGSVTLHLENHPKKIALYIEDDGPGIPPSELENVLNPFVRLEPSRNKHTGGTGLGLSIANSIIQTDGGELILENRQALANKGGQETTHATGLRATIIIPKDLPHARV